MMQIKKVREYTKANKFLTYINISYMILGIIAIFAFDNDTFLGLLCIMALINIYAIMNEENFLTLFDRINKEDEVNKK